MGRKCKSGGKAGRLASGAGSGARGKQRSLVSNVKGAKEAKTASAHVSGVTITVRADLFKSFFCILTPEKELKLLLSILPRALEVTPN